MPIEEVRGFSLTDNKIPAVVLNLRGFDQWKNFSVVHEYAHLLLDKSGICDMEEQDYLQQEDKAIERFCNHFAGAILVPKDVLLAHDLVKLRKWSDELLRENSKKF